MTKVLTSATLTAAASIKIGLESLLKHATLWPAILLALICINSPLRAAEPAPDPASFDILGMKLGMSIEEIQAAIKAYNPSFVIITNKVPTVLYVPGDNAGYSNFVQFVSANPQPPGPFPEGIAVGFTVAQPSRAFYIRREKGFALDQQPLRDNMVKQLREKYGPESSSLQGNSFNWIFDKVRKQIFGNQGCTPGNQGVFSYVGGPPLDRQYYSPTCGIKLLVQFVRSTDANVLSGLHEQLIGDSIAVDDIQKTVSEAKAVKEQQRQQQEQKASGVKTPL